MLMSMTGYGEAEKRISGDETSAACTIRVELRSVNNRFLAMKTRLPDNAQALMGPVEKMVRERLARGALQLTVDVRSDTGDPRGLIDVEMLENYARVLGELARKRGEPPIALEKLIGLPGVVRGTDASPVEPERLEREVLEVVSRALEELSAMRRAEGDHLALAIGQTLDELEEELAFVRSGAPKVAENYRERLRARMREILAQEGVVLEGADIAREVALFADRSDIAEELARLESHAIQLRRALEEGGAVGKKMEFITQEMFRESNTILAKLNDAELAERALAIKSCVERIKEQVLNVE
ncbi:MAG: YicC/YloC family endoribonuclease [Planctomycetota bacterium]